MLERVVSRSLNRVQNRQPATAEKLEIDVRSIESTRSRERQPRGKQLARSRNQRFHQRHIARIESVRRISASLNPCAASASSGI